MAGARLLDRWSAALLLTASLYLLAVLGATIHRTTFVEQDPAHYAEVAERLAQGQGATSLADRRGVAAASTFPQPFRAPTLWPWLLAPLAKITGEALVTGSVVSLLALVAALWLATLAVIRGTAAAPWLAATCVIAAVSHREAVRAAVVPLTDTVALAATTGCLGAVVMRHRAAALAWAALAVALRAQNAALALPLLALLDAGPWRRRTLCAAIALAMGAVLWYARSQAFEGLRVFLDPTQRDSLLRATRFLFPGMIVGLVMLRRTPAALPFALLALGHLLVLLAHRDSSDGRPWLFAVRHGLPFQLAAGALTAAAITQVTGWPRLLLLLCLGTALVDNLPKAVRTWQKAPEVTARPDMDLALGWLAQHPLPASAVVLSHDCDILAYYAHVPSVHLRGHQPEPVPSDGSAFASYLRHRGVTHVLLTWQASSFMQERNRMMDGFERDLALACEVLADLRTSPEPTRALWLQLRP